MLVEQGHTYVAFADRPFFVSLAALKNAGTARGFDSVVVLDRDDPAAQGLPRALLDFPGTQGHADDWNTIALGHWSGASTSMDLPSQVRAVADITTTPQPAPLDPSSPAGMLTPEACAAPWRHFLFVVVPASVGVGGLVGYLIAKHLAKK